jgi:hypothetical protein
VPQALINTTVRASLSFATNQTTTAAVASASAVVLAKGILHAMTITKIKLIGVVVLASALTFSGVTTLARQFGHNGGPVLAVVAVDPLEGKRETNQKAEAKPRLRDRLKPIFASLEKLNGDLAASIKLNQRLREELRALTEEIQVLKSEEQTSTGKEPHASSTPRKGVDKRSQNLAQKKAEAERKKREERATIVNKGPDPRLTQPAPEEPPRHFRLGSLIMVTSSRGDRVVMYYPRLANAKPLQLSVPDGTRLEVSPVESNGLNTFIALNLIGPKVTKIAVFDRKEEVWYPFELREPVGMANPLVGAWVVVYNLGKYVYAFSIQTRVWSVLELPEGTLHRFNWQEFQAGVAALTIECDGHIYTFHHENGKWDDLDTRAILDLPEDKTKDEINK